MKREMISSATSSIALEEAHTEAILGCRRRCLYMCSLWTCMDVMLCMDVVL
jgi:hypothetical protein